MRQQNTNPYWKFPVRLPDRLKAPYIVVYDDDYISVTLRSPRLGDFFRQSDKYCTVRTAIGV